MKEKKKKKKREDDVKRTTLINYIIQGMKDAPHVHIT